MKAQMSNPNPIIILALFIIGSLRKDNVLYYFYHVPYPLSIEGMRIYVLTKIFFLGVLKKGILHAILIMEKGGQRIAKAPVRPITLTFEKGPQISWGPSRLSSLDPLEINNAQEVQTFSFCKLPRRADRTDSLLAYNH